MKKLLFGLLMAVVAQTSFAQTLEKMHWFNEPEQWEIKPFRCLSLRKAITGASPIMVLR